MNRLAVIAAGILAVVTAGCGDSGSLEVTPESSLAVPTSAGTATSAPVATTSLVSTSTTTSPATTNPATTSPATTSPATTSPATTVPSTTSPEPTPTGWSPSDFRPANYPLGYSGNWDGPPSPPAPSDASQAPADGYYFASLRQAWAPGDTSLQVRVQRLEYCTVLAAGCEYYDEGSSETNLDPNWKLDLDVPLDATTQVVLTGFSCWDDLEGQTRQATGTELGDLFTSFAADYDQAIRPLLLAGLPHDNVAEAVAAGPTGGFVGEVAHCGADTNGMAGPLRYLHDDAPVLLLQTVVHWEEGEMPEPMSATDLIRLQGVDYRNGIPTFYFFAGFYS